MTEKKKITSNPDDSFLVTGILEDLALAEKVADSHLHTSRFRSGYSDQELTSTTLTVFRDIRQRRLAAQRDEREEQTRRELILENAALVSQAFGGKAGQ